MPDPNPDLDLDPVTLPPVVTPVTEQTSVVVNTTEVGTWHRARQVRDLFLKSGEKIAGWVAFIKGRLQEKSTYVFLGAGVAAASALPAPWSYISMSLSVVASMLPDHVIVNK